jgi:hypothetical protein
MAHHYVPKYYLKGFSERSGKTIWVYDKQDDKYPTQVDSTAKEAMFYSPKIEQYLANDVEGPANAVIKKIRIRSQVTDYDKKILAEYMAVMMKRVPQGKERIRELAPSIAEKMSHEITSQFTIIASIQPEKAILIQRRISEIQEILDRYSEDPPKDVWLKNIPPDRSPQVVAAIRSMTWRFLTFEDLPVFLTCDNPFFYFTRIGLGNPKSEITFPISSHITLWATWRTDLAEGYFNTTKQAIREVNRRTAYNATRYVFHCKEENWILPFVKKGKWKLNFLH